MSDEHSPRSRGEKDSAAEGSDDERLVSVRESLAKWIRTDAASDESGAESNNTAGPKDMAAL